MSTRWCYLVAKAFLPVWREGVLRTSPDLEKARKEAEAGGKPLPAEYLDCRPVVWFSAAEPWEPSTAMKVRRQDGRTDFVRDMAGNARLGGGLFRIGVAAETAPISWTDYRKCGYDRPEVCNRMAKAAKDLRADPRNWWASDRDVPRAEWTHVEEWRGGKWVAWTPPSTQTTGA